MSFTTAQSTQIKFALGYPIFGYAYLYPGTDFTIAQFGADTDASALIIGLLTSFSNLQTMLAQADNDAGIKKVDEIEFQDSKGVSQSTTSLRSSGRMIVQQISSAMGLPIAQDIFASSAPSPYWGIGG